MSAFRALRHRDYTLYFSGQLVSWVGTWMQSVALAWMVHRLTGQPKWLGIVAFVTQAPMFLLAPVGGVVADRMSPRALSMLTQGLLLGQALAMTALAWNGHPSVWMILVLAVVLGVLNAFDMPARNVLVAHTVPAADLPNAIALNSTLFHGARIVGPALAGVALAAVGEAWCFGINAASYLAALVALAFMHTGRSAAAGPDKAMAEHIAEGVRFVARDRRLRVLFVFCGAVVFMGMPYTALMPVFADTILRIGPRGMGLLMGAGGVGATLAALLLARMVSPSRLHRTMVVSALGMALFLTVFAFSRNVALSVVFMGLTGFCMVITNTGNNTLVNLIVPNELRGRVGSLYSMVFTAAMPLGALAVGYGAQIIGAPRALALGAAGAALSGLYFWKSYVPEGNPKY
jgi:MFS family permease